MISTPKVSTALLENAGTHMTQHLECVLFSFLIPQLLKPGPVAADSDGVPALIISWSFDFLNKLFQCAAKQA